MDINQLSPENKERYLRNQRRLLARQRKAEGREYMSIIRSDVGGVVNGAAKTEPLMS